MATARQHFMRALEIRQELGQMHLTAEPRVGLAQSALAEDDLEEAMDQAEAIWQLCESGPLWGVERPLWAYLTCYQVFRCVGDPRCRDVLSGAQARLRERTANIESDELRATYLEDVPENREIARLFRDLQ